MVTMNKIYQSYYTRSEPIVDYMVRKLCPQKGLKFLEPSVGDGVFLSALEDFLPFIDIDAFDLNPDAIEKLKTKYKTQNTVHFKNTDTLLDQSLSLYSDFGGVYDRIIANPPYGAWQDYDKRKLLKKRFNGLYVKETYTLFLYRCIELLKSDGRLVFIVPDTFLNLHMHSRLREYLLKNTKIDEIALFPSSFFPGISFGYAKLCIISLQKCSNTAECLSHSFGVRTGFKKVENLIRPDGEKKYYFFQKDVLKNIDSALFISEDPEITSVINNAKTRIGDIADCVTGIYSGNDKRFLYVKNHNVKNGKNYKQVEPDRIAKTDSISIDGISSQKCFVPIMKGGGIRYIKPVHWFLDWSEAAVRHYKTDKKARFQNSAYYFRSGIGVPMISSSRITGALLENRLFDQSIVGIFPKNNDYLLYLLAFFNTNLCNKFIRTINPSANNPANYIKKIPFVQPNKEIFEKVNRITYGIISQLSAEPDKDTDDLASQLDTIFESLYL
jgi:adenine-specific DNA methylase